MAVGLVDRPAVDLAQPVADRQDSPPRGALPGRSLRDAGGSSPRRIWFARRGGRRSSRRRRGRRRPDLLSANPGEGPPAVSCHGDPTHSEDWVPLLERMRGPALALDLPGLGPHGAPGPPASTTRCRGSAAFVGRFLDEMGVERVLARGPRLGRAGADRRSARAGAGLAGSLSSTRCRCCRATAGTAPRACGAPVLGELSTDLEPPRAGLGAARVARATGARMHPSSST